LHPQQQQPQQQNGVPRSPLLRQVSTAGRIQAGQVPPTFSADIVNLCLSLSGSTARYNRQPVFTRDHNRQVDWQQQAGSAAEWPGKPAGPDEPSQCSQHQQWSALAYSRHEMEEVLPRGATVLQLAESVAQHATLIPSRGLCRLLSRRGAICCVRPRQGWWPAQATMPTLRKCSSTGSTCSSCWMREHSTCLGCSLPREQGHRSPA
jgi:hypothetical protein